MNKFSDLPLISDSRNNCKKPELLSPAGGPEAAYAALAYGADAVYLGLKQFSARAEAVNFSLEELDDFTGYAHCLPRRRRVFAAVNTLVGESELPAVVATLSALNEIGVDGVIVQDLGVARIVRRYFPKLALHASTQMAVHNRRSMEMLARLGVRRVVAARELTLAEIEGLCRQRDIEVECFVHGAVCHSYSGLCLFSSHALGRSANRGRCAYVCGSFSLEGNNIEIKGKTPFAMKDLSLANCLPQLIEAGVASLKIEGRKKTALYVAAATNFYRQMLDGALDGEGAKILEDDLKSIFSRPWTELYFSSNAQNNSGESDFLGHRGVPVGRVLAAGANKKGVFTIKFRTLRRLEIRDGLQLEIPGLDQPFGFSIETLRKSNCSERMYEAEAGAEVEIPLPREHPPIPLGAAICCTSSQAVKNRYKWDQPKFGNHRKRRIMDAAIGLTREKITVRAALRSHADSLQRIFPGAAPSVETIIQGCFEPAKNPEGIQRAAEAAFRRLGDTPFVLGSLTMENPDAVFVPASQWNEIRRRVVSLLIDAAEEILKNEIRSTLSRIKEEAATAGNPKKLDPKWSIKVDSLVQLDALTQDDWEKIDEVILCLGVEAQKMDIAGLPLLAQRIDRCKIRLALPTIIRAWDEKKLMPAVQGLLGGGWSKWEVSNLVGRGLLTAAGPLESTELHGLDVIADWPLYAMNSAAATELLALGYSGITLSPEDSAENMKALLRRFGGCARVAAYQYTPLFISETCPYANLSKKCKGPERCCINGVEWISTFNNRVRVLNRNCRFFTVGQSPFCLSNHLDELAVAGASHFVLDFQYSELDPNEILQKFRLILSGEPVPDSSVGNYFRGFL